MAVYTYPVSREKLIIFGGGILCAFIVGIVLIAICSGGDDGVTVTIIGRNALKSAPLIVGHNNLAKNLKALQHNHLQNFEFNKIADNEAWKTCTYCKTDLNYLKQGMVAVQVFTVTSDCQLSSYKDSVSLVLEQIDVIRRLIDGNINDISITGSSLGIRQTFNRKIAAMLAVDGGHTIDSRFAILRTYYNLGVRILSLGNDCTDKNKHITWYNATDVDDFGQALITEMNRLGMIIDVSKLPEAVQLRVISLSEAPVIISNSNAYAITNVSNNVPDTVLKELKNKNGMVMISLNPEYIVPSTEAKPGNVTLQQLIDHVTHLKSQMSVKNIGIGGGFDDEFKNTLIDLDDPSKFPVLFDTLYKGENGWKLDELEGLAGNNFLTLLATVEKTAQDMKAKNTLPADSYELKMKFPDNLTCYSDFDERYK